MCPSHSYKIAGGIEVDKFSYLYLVMTKGCIWQALARTISHDDDDDMSANEFKRRHTAAESLKSKPSWRRWVNELLDCVKMLLFQPVDLLFQPVVLLHTDDE